MLTLPGFDEYLLGYRNRSAIISTELITRVVPGKNGIFLPLLASEVEPAAAPTQSGTGPGPVEPALA